MSGRTYLLPPRFLSIYFHEVMLIRQLAVTQSILTHWTFLVMYDPVVAALLVGNSQVPFEDLYSDQFYLAKASRV